MLGKDFRASEHLRIQRPVSLIPGYFVVLASGAGSNTVIVARQRRFAFVSQAAIPELVVQRLAKAFPSSEMPRSLVFYFGILMQNPVGPL